MNISDITNKDEFSAIIINELKTFGVKYQKEKKKKIQNKSCRKNIFRTHLHLLDLTDVILANGRVVQIPIFVAEACNRILEQVETEGIFRKAGSFVRQKEIRISLEAGVALGKSHHVIDVANVIKYFFRELPEPIIPTSIQETLLRSLLVGDNFVKAILLACLLLPPLTINTLSFFMQFLYTVSLSENLNKMSVENLAIIFTPTIMPFPNINSHRFKNHVKIVQILIENANAIGTIPRSIEYKLQRTSNKLGSEKKLSDNSITGAMKNIVNENGTKSASAKNKKKRRSEMFNGLRKIVGSAMGSSEYLDYTPNDNVINIQIPKLDENINKEKKIYNVATTPCRKENKKRKLGDPASTFSSKKKKDLLALLPSNSGGFLPNTPITKESKKSRLSLGGGRHIKNISLNPVVTSMERRWSIVGSGWSKTKNKNAPDKKYYRSNNYICDVETAEDKKLNESSKQLSGNTCSISKTGNDSGDDSDCIQISKMEYKEMKERVAAIENHISNEFGTIRKSVLKSSPNSIDMSGVERVQTQYERVVVETEALSSPATEQLAQRLSRGLNIRRSVDQCVIRSPSARKIGTIRRRSQDKVHVSRNSSWHIRSSNSTPIGKEFISSLEEKNPPNHANKILFYSKNNKPDMQNNSYNEVSPLLSSKKRNIKKSLDNIFSNDYSNEEWLCGEKFFSDTQLKECIYKVNDDCLNQMHVEHVATPVRRKNFIDVEKTPMLPPKSVPRKICHVTTPLTAIKPSTTSKLPYVNRIAISTPVVEEVSGRASIARLRAENAGMVMAKAKLFDGLGNNSSDEQRSLKEDQNSTDMQQKSNAVRQSKCHAKALNDPVCFKSMLSIEQNDIDIMEVKSKTTLISTPIAKRIQSTNLSSPASPLKRKQRGNASKYPQKQFLKSIVADDKLTIRRNLNERILNCDNGANLSVKSETLRTYNSSRNPKSPRRIKKNRQPLKLRNTPSGV
ncbi:uncharacterized protein LOC135963184 isoform X2 [Calliphora vicina]|uniref:uncharacterized protein LOC135963184 isoform X2 n=1 Tax=Calliphora vicina TaxID=7373 RepID=UPI00325A61B6